MADIVTADPSIFFQQKTPDIVGNFLQGQQMAQQAQTNKLKMSDLALQNKKLTQQDSDEQANRQAYANNMKPTPVLDPQTGQPVIDPSTGQPKMGAPQLDRQGYLSDMMSAGAGQKGYETVKQMTLQDLQQKNALIENKQKENGVVGQAIGAVLAAPPEQRPQVLKEQVGGLKNLGIDPGPIGPEHLDDGHLKALYMGHLTQKEQLEKIKDDNDFSIKKLTEENKGKELALQTAKMNTENAHFNYDNQFKANDEVQKATEGARGAKEAQQMASDIYSVDKAKDIVKGAPNGDLSKLPLTDMKVLFQEYSKVATGGVPSEKEIESLTPNNISQKLADLYQRGTNKPAPANAGQFVQKVVNYLDDVRENARSNLYQRENRIIEQRKDDLGPKNYQNFKEGLAERYKPSTVMMKDPKGNIRAVPSDQIDAAQKAGGSRL